MDEIVEAKALESAAGADRGRRLARMLAPRSVAFLGGAALEPAVGYCRELGFPGRLFAVNPRRGELAGLACVTSPAELPEVPDVGFVAVPKAAAVETVAALAAIGTPACICNTAGFAETGAEGATLEAELVAAAGDMLLLGPNCPGIVNFADRTALMMNHFGCREAVEGAALVSQGGGVLVDAVYADRSLAITHLIGTGNQAMVTVADGLAAVLEDPRVRAAGLYLEGLDDVVGLSRAAWTAQRRNVPVVAMKVGRSAAGAHAASSHTAALASDAAMASALFERLGFVEVHALAAFIETLKMLTVTGALPGRRAAVVTFSGAYAAMSADAASDAGLALPAPSAGASKALRRAMPDLATPGNPQDYTTKDWGIKDRQVDGMGALLSDPLDVAVQVATYPPPGAWDRGPWDVCLEAYGEVLKARGLKGAFISNLPEGLPEDDRRRMIAAGIAPLQGLEDGMRAVANAARATELRARLVAAEAVLLPPPAVPQGPPRALDEAEAKARLSAIGLAVPESRVVGWGEAAPDELAYPVAVKLLSAEVSHKSDLGALRLGVTGPWDAEAAMAEIRKDVALHAPTVAATRFLVEEMIEGGVAELLIGVRADPQVGLALTLAAGGMAVEIFNDQKVLLLPTRREAVAEALAGLRIAPLLEGARGRPRADLNAAVEAVLAVARYAEARRGRLLELEINPLVVRATGEGAVAADALLIEAGGI
jgi:acyl-CoA synthetase (NDP forming)